MTPTNDRQEVLNFTEPYAYVPAVVVVHEENTTITDTATDLDGKRIGVCADCTYQFFIEKSLEISGFDFDFVIDDATVAGYDTDTTALRAADSLAYLSLNGLKSAVGGEQASYCTSCYTGVYPVSFPQDEKAYLQLALKAVD